MGRSARAGPSHYSFREQLALAHARYVAWSGPAMQRAVAVNRVAQLRRLTMKRLMAIEHLLEG